jgi:hypothetical protein
MKGAYKQFDQKLFNQNDPKSREVVKTYLAANNIPVDDNPDKYGVDLISTDGSLKIEVERRLVWDYFEFPFNDINLPERKAKFFVENNVAYIIVSKDYSRLGIINGKTIKEYINTKNLKENRNRLVDSGELFYKLPKDKFKWVKV